jgi:hypothetical protein
MLFDWISMAVTAKLVKDSAHGLAASLFNSVASAILFSSGRVMRTTHD